MGPMSLTIFDMAQIFGLKPSWYFPELRAPNLEFPEGVAPTHILAEVSPTDHSTFSCLYFFKVCQTRADLEWGASEAFEEDASNLCKEKFISCIQQRDLAWGMRIDNTKYERELEVYHSNFTQGNIEEVDVGLKEAVDALVFQEAAIEAVKQGVGSNHTAGDVGDIFELFGDSKGKAELKVETWASRPLTTKKHSPTPKEGQLSIEIQLEDKVVLDTILEELKSSTPTSSVSHLLIVVAPTSQINPTTSELLHYVKDDSNLSLVHEDSQPPSTTFGEPIFPKIFVVSEATSLKTPQAASRANPLGSGEGWGQSPPPVMRKADLLRFPKACKVTGIPIPRPRKKTKNVATHVFTSSGPTTSLPTEASSSAAASKSAGVMPPPLLTSISATASLPELVCEFSLKALQDVEKALTELYQAEQMSKVQFKAFISFFENLRALRDQHQRVERKSNRVKCYQDKHT
ncbi:TMV resistance protein N-like [Pyrus ussuriensis x Pyrus communis]|uniref:TMV resistance protein N-like n=1 Tax=Pyrus ussuriensis x Pyrus communis TaxID=2448454 RepID=A0A5N5H4X6_9ROSA|nr:TMV resistance protein N-like [Pyrus ussuriensis x Pyrus communis]